MPALTMRGRYLMREYWSDTDLFTRTTAEVREFYQGLWMLSDDDGWMPRDVTGIGAALYRFEAPSDRELHVRAGIERLRRLGKLESLRCGCIFLPAVARYPRAGKRTATHHANHQTHSKGFESHASKGFEDIQTDLNPSPVPTRRSPTDRAGARDGSKNKAKNGAGLPFAFEDAVPAVTAKKR